MSSNEDDINKLINFGNIIVDITNSRTPNEFRLDVVESIQRMVLIEDSEWTILVDAMKTTENFQTFIKSDKMGLISHEVICVCIKLLEVSQKHQKTFIYWLYLCNEKLGFYDGEINLNKLKTIILWYGLIDKKAMNIYYGSVNKNWNLIK